jgi:hypothetical protein
VRLEPPSPSPPPPPHPSLCLSSFQLKEYKSAEKEAKTQHLNVWEYGDITEDDAREFGMTR